jgi:hypothetical protein
MALLKWGEDEEEKDEFESPVVKTIQSVQSGWQPTQDDAAAEDGEAQSAEPANESYLVSDQKAEFDNQVQQQRANEEAARARAAAEAADANRRAAAAQELQAASLPQDVTPVKVDTSRAIPGFQVMSPKAQQEAIRSRVVSDQQKKAEDTAKFWGNVPLVGTAMNWGAGLASVTGKLTGNRELQARADNQRKLLTLGMNTSEFNQYDEQTRNKLETLQTGVTGLGALDVFGAASLAKMPLVAGIKAASKEGITSVAGRQILKEAAQQTGQQYGKNVAVGAGVSGVVDPAMQAYIKDGDVDWSSVPSSMLQGGLWAAAIPEFSGKARLTQKLQSGQTLTPEDSLEINSALATDAAPTIPTEQPRVADGVVTPVRDSNLSFDNRTEDSQTPIEIPAFQNINPIADNFTPATSPTPAPVAGNLTPVQSPQIDMPEQLTPEAPMSLDELAERATLDNVTPVGKDIDVPTTPAPVADGRVIAPANNVPTVKSEEVRALQESRAGTSQAEEAAINQQLQQNAPVEKDYDTSIDELDAALERGDISYDEHARLEDELFSRENEAGRAMAEDGSSVPEMDAPLPTKLTPAKVAARLMPKLANNDDMKARLANAVDLGKDTDSALDSILRDGNVAPAKAERITKLFTDLDEQLKAYNGAQGKNQKAYAGGGAEALDADVSKGRSRVTRDMGITQRRLVKEIDRLEGSRDAKVAIINNMADLIGTRNANILTSAGLLERNVTQELTANLKLAAKNPIKMAKSTFNNGNIAGDTIKSELSHWKEKPTLNPIDGLKYIVGNTYRTAMIPTTMLANTRRGMYRDELTKYAFEKLEGRNLSSAEAHKLAGAAGNEMEALVNTLTGVDNGMTNRGDAEAALTSWKKYIETGSDADKKAFLEKVDQHANLADQMISGLSKDDATRARGLKAIGNLIFPFVRTATNLMRTTVRQDLNPAAKSLVDQIRSDLRSKPENAALILKSKLVDYGVMSGAVALASAGIVSYNDGDEVDKPRGWSVDIGDGKFVPVRATAYELPIALAATAQQIAQDIQEGKPREASYYTGMITGSLPYIDTFNSTTGAVDSLMNGEDAGYAAKAYGINMTKSFVPGTNNGVEAYAAGKQGESLNAKTVYASKEVPDGEGGTKKVADIPKWFENSLQSSGILTPFGKNRSDLKDSRDAAGRTRTVDNQGAITNKTINDPNSATHNDTIDALVEYGREAKLGNGTAEMFNTYDTGKNNNFKSIQDTITFLDTTEGEDGKKEIDASKKLENNAKIGVLAAQIRDGFYGDTGNDLLTLDGKELYSDVSVPNKSGTKNSRLPMNMQSIKNAVAATDLPAAQRDRMYEISQANQALYERRKNKEITYDQEQAMKTANEQEYVQILSASPNYKKMVGLMDTLKGNGFFDEGGIGSTKSGQTYLWNSLNALLGSKGATPAANYPETSKGFTPWGRGGGGGSGSKNTLKNGKTGTDGVKWTPAGKRQMASVSSGKYTPVQIKVKLGNEVKKNRTQNYSDRSF